MCQSPLLKSVLQGKLVCESTDVGLLWEAGEGSGPSLPAQGCSPQPELLFSIFGYAKEPFWKLLSVNPLLPP